VRRSVDTATTIITITIIIITTTTVINYLRPRHEADLSRPHSAKVKISGDITSTPPYVFMAWCLIN
jgi:hypothetical protein